MSPDSRNEERILILAPKGRDAQVIEQVLHRAGFDCKVCAEYAALTQELDLGAGAALIAEEALQDADLKKLANWLSRQASWSDFPFVLLVSKLPGQHTAVARNMLESLSNVVLLERPVNAETLRRATASALRARKRQYQARSDLQERTRSEEHLRIALQAARLGSWELNPLTGELHASETCKANFGFAPSEPFSYEDLLGRIHPEDREMRRQAVSAALENEAAFDIEYRVIWPDRSVHWIHIQGKTHRDELGQPARVIGVSLDVTERREAEKQLRENRTALMNLNETLESRIHERTAALADANNRLMHEMAERERAQTALMQTQKMEAVGRLTGGIAHDFNNLLSVIQGNAQLIDLFCEDEKIKHMAAAIGRASERGAKLTSQLLAFSRSQRLDLKAIDLATALEGVKTLLVSSLGSNIEVRYELGAEIPEVRGDLNQIELAILNLAINARDAMPEGGIITIRVSLEQAPPDLLTPGEYGVISVIDNGEGINEEILEKVFEPFFTTKDLGKGTGLGLSQVYGIAQQSGGTARIISKVGEGTRVEIWLPLADRNDARETATKTSIIRAEKKSRARVLVVEDDSAVRQFIVECLEILGYRVMQAANAQSGLSLLRASCPDLLITDFLMPGMTGAELVAEALRLHPQLPVLIATGYADMEAIDAVIDANRVLRKPFQIDDLASSVVYALASSRLPSTQGSVLNS